ncbi:MAG: glycosyltransferase family 4 protein, partial [Actinobacteria bacterium]|nr:glycosyltransferase family 4 protein [Actinomycetota bacterium]
MRPTVHVVEPAGWGGVYQHAASLVTAVAAAGVPVMFHTAASAEPSPADGVPRHACFWHCSEVRPRTARRTAVAGGWLARGVPSCLRMFQPGDVVHIEGWFRPALLVPLVVGARRRGCRVTLSPHNTFSRRDRPDEEWVMRVLARAAGAVFVFSEPDRARVAAWDAVAVLVPLVADPPRPRADLVDMWRRRWEAGGRDRPVVLFAGQLRPDKGLDHLVLAVSGWADDRILAVVGEDHGALGEARRMAAAGSVPIIVDEGYQPVDRFVAALAAADVVVCPYRRASQSAVLATAAALGRPTVATAVGGLAELATVAVPPDDPAALRAG